MDRRELHDALEKLHEELHDAHPVGDAERVLLAELAQDIRRVLDEPGDAGEERRRGLEGRLTESILELEESHPQLVASLRTVVNYLSDIGI